MNDKLFNFIIQNEKKNILYSIDIKTIKFYYF